MKRQQVVGFYTDEHDGKVKPITKSTAQLKRKHIILNPKKPRLPKPSWKRRPIYFLDSGMVEVGLYDKDKGVLDSVPLERYDPKLMGRAHYRGIGRPPSLKGVTHWTSPDLTPSKLFQRRAAAEKLSKGTVLELFAGRGNLSQEVWAKKAEHITLIDKNKKFLSAADKKLRGKVKHETIAANNIKWLQNEMDPHELKNLKAVDFDAFGSPAKQVKAFFDNYPVKKSILVCLTDGSNIYVAFMKDRQASRTFLKKHYGLNMKPTGKREDQIKALDSLMQQQGRKHRFVVKPVNVGFGKRQTVYAAYKITPKKGKK